MVAKCQCMVAGSPCYCRSVSASALYKAAFPLSPLFFWQQGWACPAWLKGLGPDWNEKRIKKWQTHRSAKKAGTGWSGCWDGESSASSKLSQFSSRVGEAGDSVRLDGKMGVTEVTRRWGLQSTAGSEGTVSVEKYASWEYPEDREVMEDVFITYYQHLLPRGRFCIPLNLRVLHMAVLRSTAHIRQDMTHLGLSLPPAGVDSWISVVFNLLSSCCLKFSIWGSIVLRPLFSPWVSPCAILTFWKNMAFEVDLLPFLSSPGFMCKEWS